MASIPVDVHAVVGEYIARVEKVLPVERAILFGSCAKGNAGEYSDIDIAIVSPAFTDMPRLDGFLLLMREARPLRVDIQPLPFAPGDLVEPSGILEEILNTGLEIAV